MVVTGGGGGCCIWMITICWPCGVWRTTDGVAAEAVEAVETG